MKKAAANKCSIVVILFLFPFTQGCLGPVKELYPRDSDQRNISIYIVSHGWHAGIAVPTNEIPTDVWINDDALPPVDFIEFGWGDAGYYQARQVTLGLILRASFWPTPSVLHIAGFASPVPQYFSASQVVEVRISEEGMRELAKFIAGYFQVDDEGYAIPDGDGLYGTHNSFYKAETYYYLPKTSNTWTARALRSTGAPVTPLYGLTSGNVMYQARRVGTVVGE
ncbi:MAG: DUF2459 domain-containing protein [Balneolales bacterium]